MDLNYNHIGRHERGGQLPGGSTLQELRSNSTGPRPSAHKLRAMADALGVTTDYLLGGSEDNSLKADIEDQELLDMFRRVQKLPEDKKRSVKDFLEAYLFRERVREDIA